MRSRTAAPLLVLLALFFAPLAPARAAGRKLALLPAAVANGASENGQIVTEALRASLQKQGFELLPAAEVEEGVDARKLELNRTVPVPELAKLRESLGADYLIHPRVLAVGTPLNAKTQQATVLLNAIGPSSTTSFLHTRQIGQTFLSGSAPEQSPVIDRRSADTLAGRLLEGFLRRVRRAERSSGS